jgi:hypothetical protein
VAEKIWSTEKSDDLTGNAIRDLPACSILPQPIMLPHAPLRLQYKIYVSKQDKYKKKLGAIYLAFVHIPIFI